MDQNCKRKLSKAISKINMSKASFYARNQPNHTILVERLVRQGVSRQIAEGFARHLDRQACNG